VYKSSSHTNSTPKPLGAPFTLVGGIWFQIAWQVSHTARRQTPNSSNAAPSPPGGPQPCRQAPRIIQGFCYTIPPGRTNPAARRHASTVATVTILGLHRLAGRPAPPGAIRVAQCYWFLAY